MAGTAIGGHLLKQRLQLIDVLRLCSDGCCCIGTKLLDMPGEIFAILPDLR